MLLCLLLVGPSLVRAEGSVQLEERTWTEVRDLLRTGTTTIIIPTGGTEQNGPHMVLGKHNVRVKYAAAEIARRLGNALVAPVLAYVPEGNIDPPTGHMWAPGSITLPPDVFAQVVESAARGFAAQGFRDIVMIGDSGPNQAPLRALAERLDREWAAQPARALYISAYYDAQGEPFEDWLRAQGESTEAIGTHAGLADTSLLLAVDPDGVRMDKLAPGHAGDGSGVSGDPRSATVRYGKQGMVMAIDAAVTQIRQLRRTPRQP